MPAGAVGPLALIQIGKSFGLIDAAQPLLQPRLQLLAHLPHQLGKANPYGFGCCGTSAKLVHVFPGSGKLGCGFYLVAGCSTNKAGEVALLTFDFEMPYATHRARVAEESCLFSHV